MAGEIPDVYARFIADTTQFVADVLKATESVAELTKNLYQADFAAALFQGNLEAAAAAAAAATDAATNLADVQARLADAEKLAADSAAAEEQASSALFDVLAGMADAERAAAEAAVALADAEKAAADAAKLAADGMKVAADAEIVAGAKAKESAGMMGLFTAAADRAKASMTLFATKVKEGAGVMPFLTGAVEKSGAALQALAAKSKLAFEALGVGIIYSIDQAAKFDATITQLHTAAGAPLQDLPAIRQQMLQLGDQYGFSGKKMADAMYHAESAGLDLKTSLNVVADAAKLADIHSASLENTTYSLSSVMKAFNLQASDAGKTAALLNAIVGEGDMRFEQFNASIKNWAPTAASMGISIQSMGAAIAYLTDRGNSAEVAATRLTMGLSMMTSGSKQANAYLHELGLTADFVSAKNQTLADMMTKAGLTTNQLAADLKKPDGVFVALKDLQNAFHKAGLSAEESNQLMAKIFGGGRSDKAIMSLMQNLDGVKQKFDGIGGSVKDFESSAQKAAQTPEQGFKNLLATVQNLAIEFGSAMLPGVQALAAGLQQMFADPTFVKGMQDFGKYLGEVFRQAEPLVPVIMKLASQLMQALGPALPPLAKAVTEFAKALGDQLGKVIQAIGPQLPTLAKAMGQMLLALLPLLPPLAKLLIALTPLITVTAEVATEFAYMGQSVAIAAAFIIDKIATMTKWVVGAIKWFTQTTYDMFKWLYDVLIGHSIIPDLINGMTDWFQRGVDKVRSILSWFEGVPGMFSRWMQGMVDAVSRGVSQVIGLAQSLPGRILGALGNLGSLLYNAGVSVIQGLINGIQSNLGSLYGIVGGIAGAISNLKGPIDKDRVLLHPHGQALMAGLQAGIEQGLVDVYGTVSQVAEEVAAQVASPHHHHAAHGHGHHHPAHHPALHHQRPHPMAPEPAGVGYSSGVGALAYGAGGQIIHNTTIIQVQGSVISDRDLDRIVRKNSTQRSLWNSTSGLTVPSGRTG